MYVHFLADYYKQTVDFFGLRRIRVYEKAVDVGRCFSVKSGLGCRRESLHVG